MIMFTVKERNNPLYSAVPLQRGQFSFKKMFAKDNP